jgi:hypothetical protein
VEARQLRPDPASERDAVACEGDEARHDGGRSEAASNKSDEIALRDQFFTLWEEEERRKKEGEEKTKEVDFDFLLGVCRQLQCQLKVCVCGQVE